MPLGEFVRSPAAETTLHKGKVLASVSNTKSLLKEGYARTGCDKLLFHVVKASWHSFVQLNSTPFRVSLLRGWAVTLVFHLFSDELALGWFEFPGHSLEPPDHFAQVLKVFPQGAENTNTSSMYTVT